MENSILNELKVIENYLKDYSEILDKDIRAAASKIINAINSGNKIITFGNGGSASDAQHFVCEIVGTFLDKKRKALPAVCLNTNVSNITSIGNDLGFENIFSRQTEGLCCENDIVIAYSTSGNSLNVIKGINSAKNKKAYVISVTGNQGGQMKEISDMNINVALSSTPRIQEIHAMINHLICEIIDREFSGK